MGPAKLRQRPAHADHGHRARRIARPFSQYKNGNRVFRSLRRMAQKSKSGKNETHLAPESDLKKRIDIVLRLGKIAGADETEVHVDETIDALTRFANNAIHQNDAENGITTSIRTVVDDRTTRV